MIFFFNLIHICDLVTVKAKFISKWGAIYILTLSNLKCESVHIVSKTVLFIRAHPGKKEDWIRLPMFPALVHFSRTGKMTYLILLWPETTENKPTIEMAVSNTLYRCWMVSSFWITRPMLLCMVRAHISRFYCFWEGALTSRELTCELTLSICGFFLPG